MDFETQRKKRQEALDEKRKRLEEMKKKKESKAFEVPMVISPPSSPVKISTKESDDALLNSLLSHSKTEFEKQIKSPSPVVNDKVKLVTVKGNAAINIFPIPPMTTYSKMVQTEEDSGFLPLGNNHDFHVSNNNSLVTPAKNSVPKQSEKKVGGWGKLKGHIVTSTKVEIPNFEEKKVEVDSITKVLSEEEKKNIINSKDFSKFLNFSSLIIERALNQIEQTSDIVRNYSHDQNNTVRKLGEIKPLEAFTPYEEEALKHRPIMDVKYSSIVSGLFLATYGSKNLYNNQIQTTARGNTTSSTAATTTTTVGVNYNINDDDNAPGMLCIWSKALHKRPEFKFIASSPVLTGIFHNADQYLVLGGCYNGQILLWDMRNGRSLPVQRSNLAGKGHKHPVYAMSMISVAVANQLVSVSTDGLICQWDISRLSEPHTISHLNIPTASLTSSFSTFLLNGLQEDPTSGVTSPLNVSCMSFFGNNDETPSMMFGSGAGVLYKKSLNLKSNESIQPANLHLGMITSIQPHPSVAKKHHKNLLLTSSLDWTVKLWNQTNFSTPLIEFVSRTYDYVNDVQWSPIHPGLFCTITSSGKLSLWNICVSVTDPVDVIVIVKDLLDNDVAGSNNNNDGNNNAGSSINVGSGGSNLINSSTIISKNNNSSSNNLVSTALATNSVKNNVLLKNNSSLSSFAALNKLCWSKDGFSILVADASGSVHLIMVHQSIAVPTSADLTKFEQVLLASGKSNNATFDELSLKK